MLLKVKIKFKNVVDMQQKNKGTLKIAFNVLRAVKPWLNAIKGLKRYNALWGKTLNWDGTKAKHYNPIRKGVIKVSFILLLFFFFISIPDYFKKIALSYSRWKKKKNVESGIF